MQVWTVIPLLTAPIDVELAHLDRQLCTSFLDRELSCYLDWPVQGHPESCQTRCVDCSIPDL